LSKRARRESECGTHEAVTDRPKSFSRSVPVEPLVSPRPEVAPGGDHFLSFSATCEPRQHPAVRQQVVNPAGRMCAHPVEHVAEISERLGAPYVGDDVEPIRRGGMSQAGLRPRQTRVHARAVAGVAVWPTSRERKADQSMIVGSRLPLRNRAMLAVASPSRRSVLILNTLVVLESSGQ
jgi:hypothetical protein